MRSTACKKANELIKKGYSRSRAFKEAWKIAKSVSGTDLKAGDVIRCEYGDYGNWAVCTVVSKSAELFLGKYYIVKAVAENGLDMEFCVAPDSLQERVFNRKGKRK